MHDPTHASRARDGLPGRFDNTTAGQLAHLNELDDYEIADGEPDIEGWDVRTVTGEKVGTVEDLIVDTALMKVRYIEIKFDRLLMDSGEMRHVLVPIGSVQLDDDDDDVIINLHEAQLATLPAYARGTLTRSYETEVMQGFAHAESTPVHADDEGRDFYGHDYFDEDRAFSRRRAADRPQQSYLRRLDE
jgi:sporulation protein YlmC with PRC-barrel domain